jgi:hypothetical protein
MSNTILHIDLGKIDAEIAELERKLTELQNVKNTLVKYASGGVTTVSLPSTSSNGNSAQRIPPGRTISEFIIQYLRIHGEVESSNIVNDYAEYVRSDRDDIRPNIANALQRLKGSRIDYRSHGNGRRGGGVWFVKS